MSTDREAVVWTRLPRDSEAGSGSPHRMGRLYVTDRECRFTYDEAFLDTGLPGVGLVYAPQYFGKTTIVRERSECFDLLPPLQSLIPPRERDNFQRNLSLKYLARQGISNLSGFDADWEILKISGHGGIGHLDVFADDQAAENWYANAPAHSLHPITDELGFSLKEFMTWFDDDLDVLIQTVGPTPSVGGAIPKLLLSIPASGWDGRIGLPTRGPTPGITDVVLKFEQSTRYPGIIELEALALDIHREAGFDTPRYWRCQFKDMPALAVERFDRDAHNMPVFTETLFSVLASGAPLTSHYDYRYDLIAKAIDTSAIRIVSQHTEAKQHLFKRFILALLTGNGDLHLENLSIVQHGNECLFSSVYDPAPMRAYSQHDMLSVMPFGDYAEMLTGQDQPVGFAQAIDNFASTCGLPAAQKDGIIDQLLTVTRNYSQRVGELHSVPEENRERLISRVDEVRRRFDETG